MNLLVSVSLEDLIRVVMARLGSLPWVLHPSGPAPMNRAAGRRPPANLSSVPRGVEDYKICLSVTVTREHHFVFGGETCVVTNDLKYSQHMVVRAVPLPSMVKASIDVVPAPITTHEVFRAAILLIRERSKDRVVCDPKY
jgi:hypothetical protein